MSEIVADLHLHSSYARATSKNLNFDTLTNWAKIKGISLLSSADFTHPVWFAETKAKLKQNSDGFLTYQGFNFILGGEVSCVFSQGGKLRRVHLLIYAPDLEVAAKINQKLGEKGKLGSDGRPILGMRAKDVLETVLEADKDSIMIPAHVWTPWFGVLGANGGFDSLEECFGDLSKYIYGIETGLSSDPAMNWRIKELDEKAIVSFSDAHSPAKMGRELTIFDTNPSYQGILKALKGQEKTAQQFYSTSNPREMKISNSTKSNSLVPTKSQKSDQFFPKISETIEFFPEEGKYHLNGHRNCNFRETPEETLKRDLLCPSCHRPLTIGVLQRVTQLAEKDRGEDFVPQNRPGFKRLVPLLEILAEVIKAPVSSKRTFQFYEDLIQKFENELNILTLVEPEAIGKETDLPKLAEAIDKVRKGDIFIDAGYDGVYGMVKIWPEDSVKAEPKIIKDLEKTPQNQMSLFEKA